MGQSILVIINLEKNQMNSTEAMRSLTAEEE